MHWRRYRVSEIPLDDQKDFEKWLLARWTEKDQLIEECYETGRFPTDLAGTIETGYGSEKQKIAASNGYAETSVRLGHWTELLQIFGVLFGVACLCTLPSLLGLW